jgi:hemoglobin
MDQVTEAQIAAMVRVFYERARQHENLGVVFNTIISDWDHHLGVIQDFWSHVLLGTNRYKRQPFQAHVGLPIKPEHLGQWLSLFRPAALDTLPPEAAAKAIARAELIAESFRVGLFPLNPIS